MIEAENAKRVLHLKAIDDDAPRPVTHAVAPELEAAAAADDALPARRALQARLGSRSETAGRVRRSVRELSGFQQGRGQGQA